MGKSSDRVLILFDGDDPNPLRNAVPRADVLVMDSLEELAYSLVNSEGIAMLICEPGEDPAGLASFLRSVKQSFPVVPIAVIADTAEHGDVFASTDLLIDPETYRSGPNGALADIIMRNLNSNRRQHHRFDWPLEATLYQDGKAQTARRVRALSAGGAYLEDSDEKPGSSSFSEITIHFQNFTFSTQCTVLDRRIGSSMFPPGFGIRFENLSTKGKKIIDRMVNDALMEILLDPTARPEVPSLDENELDYADVNEFTLTD